MPLQHQFAFHQLTLTQLNLESLQQLVGFLDHNFSITPLLYQEHNYLLQNHHKPYQPNRKLFQLHFLSLNDRKCPPSYLSLISS